jgi:hypothetical protein
MYIPSVSSLGTSSSSLWPNGDILRQIVDIHGLDTVEVERLSCGGSIKKH